MDIENFLIGSELKEVINLIMQNLGKTRATSSDYFVRYATPAVVAVTEA